MRVPALALLLVCVPVSLAATAVVVFRNDGGIILATDSRLTEVDADGALRFRAGGSKVLCAGKWLFANGGFTRGADLDVNAVVARAIAPTATLEAAMRAVSQVYITTIQQGILKAPYYQKKAVGTPVVALFVAGLDGGAPSVGRFGSDVRRQQPLELEPYWSVCPGRLCPDGRLLYGVSQPGPIVDLIGKRPRPDWLERADADAARRLIELQIQATPERVGGPINLVEVITDGVRWVDRDRSSACPVLP